MLRIPLTGQEIADRAIRMLVSKPRPKIGPPRPIGYRKDDSGRLGGDDPTAEGCWDWSYGDRVATADCIGFALWCVGLARLQKGYKGSRGEWLNCASVIDDAHGASQFFIRVSDAEARVGDLLISRDHVGVVIRPATCDDKGEVVHDHLVVDCSPRHSGRPWSNPAVGTGGSWSHYCQVVRRADHTEPL